jgi:ATP-dependent exoDNAse (exonuclease V) beta subunit
MIQSSWKATHAAVLQAWQQKNEFACEMGGEVHEWIENFLDGKAIPVDEISNDTTRDRVKKFMSLYDSRLSKLQFFAKEVRMFDLGLELCGTFDSLALFNGEIWMIDHKTNGKMTTDKDRAFRQLLPPFADQAENKLNEYSIQLSMYALMLERVNIHVKGMALNYLPPDGEARLLACKNYVPQLKKYFGV